MSELHIAITIDQPEVVRSILSQDLCNIHQIDENGDQPAHIAARLNRLECMKHLIEHDARMGRKNFNGLTPLGEAQMHGHREMVELIKNNYTTHAPQEYIWDEEITRECAAWYDAWDEEKQRVHWVRLGPDGSLEISETPPPMDIQRVLLARDKYGERDVVRRIHPDSLISYRQLEYERRKKKEEENIKLLLAERSKLVEERCATRVQAYWRRLKAKRLARQRQREEVAANRIKRRLRYFLNRRKQRSAILIQSFLRMTQTRTHYHSYLHSHLWWHRASRILALTTQRLWRGFLSRSYYRRLYEMHTLPDPLDTSNVHNNFEFWEQCQYEAHPPKRELGIYAEYTLSGTPRTWHERNCIKRQGVYYRDVIFYANTITKRASWTKPKGWKFKDRKEYYVFRVQTFWRARVAKRKIRMLVKAKTLLENANNGLLLDNGGNHRNHNGNKGGKDDYLDNTPKKKRQDITSLCNYTLYLHVMVHDYERARESYGKIMDFMCRRGVDNPFVLYSCAIFGAVTNEEDWEEIKDYIRRAKEAEEFIKQRKKALHPSSADATSSASSSASISVFSSSASSAYEIATCAFYLQAVSGDVDIAENWHNYALCQMLVHDDFEGARESFHKAMVASPHDKRIISNFNTLLQDEDYMGLATNAYEEYLRLLEEEEGNKKSNNKT